MTKPLVFNIQKYSLHDGEGIRTTVFFKGCPLTCRWCHNPESQRYQKEILFHGARCTGCGACVAECPNKAISFAEGTGRVVTNYALCDLSGYCMDVCVNNVREEAGKAYELRDLIRELEKDKMFYEQSGGGITFSGGECLAQDMNYIEALAKQLYLKGYSVNIDTCGYVPYENIRRVLPYADTFLYDIKLMEPEAHKYYVGVDNNRILENLKRLSDDGGKINIRLPLIDGVNADDTHIDAVINFLKSQEIRVYRINLLKYHNTGSAKYEKLGRIYEKDGMSVPETEWMESTLKKFHKNGFTNIQIGG